MRTIGIAVIMLLCLTIIGQARDDIFVTEAIAIMKGEKKQIIIIKNNIAFFDDDGKMVGMIAVVDGKIKILNEEK